MSASGSFVVGAFDPCVDGERDLGFGDPHGPALTALEICAGAGEFFGKIRGVLFVAELGEASA